MLLESIFAAAFILFLCFMALISAMKHFNLWAHKRYEKAIMISYLLSGLVTIIASIWWIVRAWG